MGYIGPEVPEPASGNAAMWEYGYMPSLAMGIVGAVTFFAISQAHLYYLFTKRGTRSVHGLFFFGCATEALGYGARLYSHGHPFNGMAFLLGIYLIQVATILLTAALYKSVQRVLKYTPDGQKLSPLRARSLVTLFVILDSICVVLQIAGQYYVAAAKSAEITGDTPFFTLGTSGLIFLAGAAGQAISIIVAASFVVVIMRRAARLLAHQRPNVQYPHIRPLLTQVLISFGIFLVRLVVRIAQGAQGLFEYAAITEWVFGVFEYAPVVLTMCLWAARPLYKFIFPLGHRHGEGAHVTDDVEVVEVGGGSPATTAAAHDIKAASGPL